MSKKDTNLKDSRYVASFRYFSHEVVCRIMRVSDQSSPERPVVLESENSDQSRDISQNIRQLLLKNRFQVTCVTKMSGNVHFSPKSPKKPSCDNAALLQALFKVMREICDASNGRISAQFESYDQQKLPLPKPAPGVEEAFIDPSEDPNVAVYLACRPDYAAGSVEWDLIQKPANVAMPTSKYKKIKGAFNALVDGQLERLELGIEVQIFGTGMRRITFDRSKMLNKYFRGENGEDVQKTHRRFCNVMIYMLTTVCEKRGIKSSLQASHKKVQAQQWEEGGPIL